MNGISVESEFEFVECRDGKAIKLANRLENYANWPVICRSDSNWKTTGGGLMRSLGHDIEKRDSSEIF